MESVTTAVADGGPPEQKSLLNMSANGATVKFPSLVHVDRDRPHRHRSVMKGAWKYLEEPVKSLLDSLMTGERSLFRLIQTSQRYKKYFAAAQNETTDCAERFADTMRNLAYAEQRYDSRSRPLFRFFQLLPVAIQTLVKLVEHGSEDEVRHATDLLASFSGDDGWVKIISAAVAADSMIVGWSFIRLGDKQSADYSLAGPEAAQQLHQLRSLLKHGGLFLEEASESLTHCALRATKDKFIFFKDKVIMLHWPDLKSPKLKEPRRMAKKYLECSC